MGQEEKIDSDMGHWEFLKINMATWGFLKIDMATWPHSWVVNVCGVKHLMCFSGDCWVLVNIFTGDYIITSLIPNKIYSRLCHVD